MARELINKAKIYQIAVENAEQGKNWYTNAELHASGLNFLEQQMLFAFTYYELLSKLTSFPKKLKNQKIREVNTILQCFARETEAYKDYSKRQIELIIPTEAMRTELTHCLHQQKYYDALTVACKLIDIYEFGIANSQIYSKILEQSRAEYIS